MEQAGVSTRLQVAIPVFEGPLELLLALADREELDILQVPLAQLTNAYLSALVELDRPEPAEMADFLWMAARLLLLKSIRLLPGEKTDDEEQDLLGWEEDVRRRLNEYRMYKAMAEGLMQRAAGEPFAFPPPPRAVEVEGQEEPLEVDLLMRAFESVLARVPPQPVVVTGRAWTLEAKLEALETKLREGPVDVAGLILESEDRLEAVVTFVALLELLRRGAVRVTQPRRFGPIQVQLNA